MKHLRDLQQIPLVTINGFCTLYKTPSTLPILKGQYQAGWNTKQDQIKNMHLFDILFQVLKLLLILLISATSFYISCCFTSAF